MLDEAEVIVSLDDDLLGLGGRRGRQEQGEGEESHRFASGSVDRR